MNTIPVPASDRSASSVSPTVNSLETGSLSTQTAANANPTSESTIQRAKGRVIAGAVVGVLVGLICITLAVFVILRRRHRSKVNQDEMSITPLLGVLGDASSSSGELKPNAKKGAALSALRALHLSRLSKATSSRAEKTGFEVTISAGNGTVPAQAHERDREVEMNHSQSAETIAQLRDEVQDLQRTVVRMREERENMTHGSTTAGTLPPSYSDS